MTERKPPNVSWESWIDRQIRDSHERGEFEDLPGAGKPIPDLDQPHDEFWWVKRKLKREGVSFIPPTLAIRKELEDALERIARERTESGVRRIVAEINARIIQVNRTATAGPPSSLMPLDVELVVRRWTEDRK